MLVASTRPASLVLARTPRYGMVGYFKEKAMSLAQIVWGVIGIVTLSVIAGLLYREWQELRRDARPPRWPYF